MKKLLPWEMRPMPPEVRATLRTTPVDLRALWHKTLFYHGDYRLILDRLVDILAKQYGRNLDLTYRAKRQKDVAQAVRNVLAGYDAPMRYLAQAMDPSWMQVYREFTQSDSWLYFSERMNGIRYIVSWERSLWVAAQIARYGLYTTHGSRRELQTLCIEAADLLERVARHEAPASDVTDVIWDIRTRAGDREVSRRLVNVFAWFKTDRILENVLPIGQIGQDVSDASSWDVEGQYRGEVVRRLHALEPDPTLLDPREFSEI